MELTGFAGGSFLTLYQVEQHIQPEVEIESYVG
jgi:hypothetical protein